MNNILYQYYIFSPGGTNTSRFVGFGKWVKYNRWRRTEDNPNVFTNGKAFATKDKLLEWYNSDINKGKYRYKRGKSKYQKLLEEYNTINTINNDYEENYEAAA